jgi:hypothetical protein
LYLAFADFRSFGSNTQPQFVEIDRSPAAKSIDLSARIFLVMMFHFSYADFPEA